MAAGRSDRAPRDLYDVLGVPDTASGDDIVRAYRRLARDHHPDHDPARGSKRFQEITDAYGVIGDPERRRAYDARRSGSVPSAARRIPVNHRRADGDPPPEPARNEGRPVIELTADEAATGVTVTIEITDDRPCPDCRGTGLQPPAPGGCPACGGTGSIVRRSGQLPVRFVCRDCAGQGRAAPGACVACGTAGVVPVLRPVKVRIPPGVRHGSTIRIPLRGSTSPLYAAVRVVPVV